ncbi:MAG: tetraacyldisaccharide 4'-kinase, partial [Pseudomonadota bacterium]
MAGAPWRLCTWELASTLALPAAVLALTRSGAAERLTWRLPAVEPGALWLHAASLGEGQAAAALAVGIAARWPDLPLLRTATSRAGREQVLPVDDCALLPLDAAGLPRRFLRRVRPRALVLVESELWPGLLAACAGRIPIAMLGLRVGEGTRRFARLAPGLLRSCLRCASVVCARGPEDAAWLAPWVGRDVPVLGDLKLEAPVEAARLRLPGPALLAASTRPGDEAALLAAWSALDPRPFLVLAPRHRERFDEVAGLLERHGLAWRRRSALEGATVPAGVEVLLLDSHGELAGLYPQARVAFVGGTFDAAIGGHSAAEPARAGVAVVHGPKIGANAASFARALAFPAANQHDLAAALRAALSAHRPAPVAGEAVARALALLVPFAGAPVPAEVSHRPLAWPGVPAVAAARGLHRLLTRPVRGPLPVIAVGNLASGGTGKTPVVRWLWAWLAARGLRVAVLSRGYGRDGGGPALRDSIAGPVTAAWLGDEPAMLARGGALVVSCPDRLMGARRAVALGADLCLLDDGLQQRGLAVDLAIAVVDARAPGAGGPLPVGEAREPPRALGRAQVVWCNHGPLLAGL